MPIQTTCPNCQRPLRVPDTLIGKAVRCPGCETVWTVESSPPAEPPPSEQPPVEEKPADAFRESLPAGDSPKIESEPVQEKPADSVPVPPPPPDDLDDDEEDPEYYEHLEDRRRRRLRRGYRDEAKQKVLGPAIGLMVGAGGHFLSALYGIGNGVFSVAFMASMPRPAGPGPGATPMFVVGGGYILAGIILLVLGAVTLYGAIEMMRLRKYKLAMTASILAMVPCNCCFGIVGIPFGIWGLVVLLDPKVKAVFTGSTPSAGAAE